MPQLEKIDDVYLLRFSQPDDPEQAPDNVFSRDFLDSLEGCLDELEAAITERLQLLETYPAGPRRDKAIERHRQAAAQIDAWRQELPADVGTETPRDTSEHGVNHHEHALSAI